MLSEAAHRQSANARGPEAVVTDVLALSAMENGIRGVTASGVDGQEDEARRKPARSRRPDAGGHDTVYAYDSADRRTSVPDALASQVDGYAYRVTAAAPCG
jgi:YD repeat-containing protein